VFGRVGCRGVGECCGGGVVVPRRDGKLKKKGALPVRRDESAARSQGGGRDGTRASGMQFQANVDRGKRKASRETLAKGNSMRARRELR